MTDHFALLNEARRPWIDPDTLKTKFLALSAKIHPDRFASATEEKKLQANRHYAALNTAYNCLREPKECLQHFLELESGLKPKDAQPVSTELTELFFEIGSLCKRVDGFLAEKQKTNSPLLRAQFFEPGQEWMDQLDAAQRGIVQRRDSQLERLRASTVEWAAVGTASAARAEILNQLEDVWRSLSFLSRWGAQIQERHMQLTF